MVTAFNPTQVKAASSAMPAIQALIIDSNATSRSILVAQLREYGAAKVVQCSRIQDARNKLEHTVFDYVLCEQFFHESNSSGQTLLDDLRRAQLLPFSTVFFMVTSEASYAAVAEAAESALDGYLLKPFTPSALFDRLSAARLRKKHLRPIFEAIEEEDFERAAQMCVEHFTSRRLYWLYAARIGSELLLRLGRHQQAKELFDAVIAAQALPWAKLGVARAQIEGGQAVKAVNTLQDLIGDDPSFADAYDVLGRAQVELGHFAQAMDTYRTASAITPDSIVRLQKLGMMSYYMGDISEAVKTLSRAAILGMESKLFDHQSMVLLAFAYFDTDDRKGIERCLTDLNRLLEKYPDNSRLKRFITVTATLQLVKQQQVSRAVEAIKDMVANSQQSDFDFESACNLCSLITVLTSTSIELEAGPAWIRAIGIRYANTKGLTELLANACHQYPNYGLIVRECLQETNKTAEKAMSQSLGGDADGAINQLLNYCDATRNSKILDIAQQMLVRNKATMQHSDTLQRSIDRLRNECGSSLARATLGQDNERHPGGVALRLPSSDSNARIKAKTDGWTAS